MEAREKIAEVRREAEEWMDEACQLAVESFKVSEDFKRELALAIDSFKMSEEYHDA